MKNMHVIVLGHAAAPCVTCEIDDDMHVRIPDIHVQDIWACCRLIVAERNVHSPQQCYDRIGVGPQLYPIAVARKLKRCSSNQHPKAISVWRRREVA